MSGPSDVAVLVAPALTAALSTAKLPNARPGRIVWPALVTHQLARACVPGIRQVVEPVVLAIAVRNSTLISPLTNVAAVSWPVLALSL